jgi:predicted small lipoprotein YifL
MNLMFETSVAVGRHQRLWRWGKVLLIVSAIGAAGCGQKGPLTLPATAASAAHAASAPAR